MLELFGLQEEDYVWSEGWYIQLEARMLNVLGFKTMYITPSSVVESLVTATITGSNPKDAAALMKILPIAILLTFCQLSSKSPADRLD
jgi:hypothetical protein